MAPGQAVKGTGVDAGLHILSQLTGSPAGGVGTYQLSGTDTVGSEAMTTEGMPVAVTYDSQSGAFVIRSTVTGAISTAAYCTGTAAAALLLTQATGAVLQQGAAAATPAGIMNGAVAVTSDWATYGTSFDPDGGSGNTVKQAFAAWKNAYPNRFMYVCWDPDPNPRRRRPSAPSSRLMRTPVRSCCRS